VRVVVTRIEWDGTMQRRMVDTAGRIDGAQWEELAARALAILPLYRPVPRIPVYHISVDDAVIQAAEHDLTGALLDLITAVLALGEELLHRTPGRLFLLTIHRPLERQPGRLLRCAERAGWPPMRGADAGRGTPPHPRVDGRSTGVAKRSQRAMIGR
jgi:hypothetical protein